MTPPTFYVDETYGPRLVGLLQAIDLPAVSYRDVSDIELGDRDVDRIPNSPPCRRHVGGEDQPLRAVEPGSGGQELLPVAPREAHRGAQAGRAAQPLAPGRLRQGNAFTYIAPDFEAPLDDFADYR